jgi:isopenicillin-N epimerase
MAGFGRRTFLSHLAVPGLAAGFSSRGRADPRPGALVPAPGATDAAVFAEARRHFFIPQDVAYFNTGTLGASPREVVGEMVRRLELLETELADWDYTRQDGEPLTGYQHLTEFRSAVGALVGAAAEEIALTQNATMGMGFLANGLDLRAGDEVVTTDQEHVGGISPWRLAARRRGVVVKELALAPALPAGPAGIVDLFARAMTARTRVLVFSHVTSSLGILTPVRELSALARSRGALALVDGAQAVGQLRVDVKALGCDGYVASPHKWLLAPKGTGFLYIRREAQDRFWTTLASRAFEDRTQGAFRFMQYGTGSLPLVHGLLAALKFNERIGQARIERWDAMLTRRLRDGLARIRSARLSSPADPRLAAAITTFRVEGIPARAFQEALWRRKLRVRAQGDDKGVRLSAHLYNSPADIDAVLEVAASVKAT